MRVFLVFSFFIDFFPKYQFVYLFIHKLDHLFFSFTQPELKFGINLNIDILFSSS